MGLCPWRFESSLRHQYSDAGLPLKRSPSSVGSSGVNTRVPVESLLDHILREHRFIECLEAHEGNRYLLAMPAHE